MKRTLVLLLVLATLLPTVQAENGIELQPDADSKDLSVQAQPGQSVQATVGYTLTLAAAMPLKLLSRLADASGNGLPHNATWRLDGQAAGTTTELRTITLPSRAAGSHTLVLVWTAPRNAVDTLKLQPIVQQATSGSAGSASGTAVAAVGQTQLTISRSGATGTGTATVGSVRPAILAFSFDRRAESTLFAWGSSVPAAAVLTLDGAGGDLQRTVASNVRFIVDVGTLPDGVYAYNVTATAADGSIGWLAGQVRLDAIGRGFSAPAGVAAALAAALAQPVRATDLFLLDQDRDGHADQLVDAGGLVEQVRALPQEGRYLVKSTAGPQLAMVEVNTGNVRTVQAVAATAGKDTVTGSSRQVQVSVADKSGWILVTVVDAHPGESLLGLQRSDGSPLPTEAFWRAGGLVRFVDDPAASYALLYAVPPSPGLTLGLGLGILGVGLLVGAVLMLLVRRRIQ